MRQAGLPNAPAPRPEQPSEPSGELPLRRTGLSALLAATARRHPERLALADPADKPDWSGRPAATLGYGALADAVARLAGGLRGWRLAPGSRVGLALAGSSEALIAHLAVEAAGHVPCLLPPAWDEEQLLAGVQNAAVAAVLTQGRFGTQRPAERLCRVAARYFGLRYLAAFGPDVPDGVACLDTMLADEARPGAAPPDRSGLGAVDTGGGLVSFVGGDPAAPVHRPGDALLAAVAVHLVATRVGPGERILSLLPPSDLRGVVTGLGAALVSGACLETLPVFGSAGLAAALAQPVWTHLVAPAFLEEALAAALAAGPPASLRSVSFAHRAPARLTARSLRPSLVTAGPTLVDVLALDETAILSCTRGADDLALTLADPERARLPAGLLALRREADGRLGLRGQASKAAPLQRGASARPEAGAWTATRFRPTLFAGTATGLAEA